MDCLRQQADIKFCLKVGKSAIKSLQRLQSESGEQVNVPF